MSRSPFPSVSDEKRADHRRDLAKHDLRLGDRLTSDQITAVARLTVLGETIARTGLLGEVTETTLRKAIAETLTAFQMPSLPECAAEPFPGEAWHGG